MTYILSCSPYTLATDLFNCLVADQDGPIEIEAVKKHSHQQYNREKASAHAAFSSLGAEPVAVDQKLHPPSGQHDYAEHRESQEERNIDDNIIAAAKIHAPQIEKYC